MRLPRLNRTGKIVRNLLTVLALTFLLWAYSDFQAPSLQTAVNWKAETYFLEEPEVLGIFDRENRDGYQDVLLRSGDVFASAAVKRRFPGFYDVSGFQFAANTGEQMAVLQQVERFRGPEALYVWADVPGAVRAECKLRLQSDIDTRIHVEDVLVANEHYDWDETYTMTAEPTEKNVYRFAIQRKYPERDPEGNYRDQTLQMAEESSLRDFQFIPGHTPGPDFTCDLRVTFYGADGTVLETYEKALWNENIRRGGTA